MKGDKELYKKAKGFDVNPQNINLKGPPRKTIATVNIELEALGYTEATKNDIISCYLRLIQMALPGLTAIVNDVNQPAMIRIVGKAILSGKGFDVIERVLDRGIGKVQQSLDVTTKGNEIGFLALLKRASSESEDEPQ